MDLNWGINVNKGENVSIRDYCWERAKENCCEGNPVGIYWDHFQGYCRGLKTIAPLKPFPKYFGLAPGWTKLCILKSKFEGNKRGVIFYFRIPFF